MTDYTTAKEEKLRLEKELDVAEKNLKAIRGIDSGLMGLTPEHIRNSAEFQAARRLFDQKMKQMQDFNRQFIRIHGKRWREELQAKRMENAAK